MATAGVVLGFASIILWAVILIFAASRGALFFSALKGQFEVAPDVAAASAAADEYAAANDDSYEGLTVAGLADYGFTQSEGVTIETVVSDDGSAYCVEGFKTADPNNVIHMPILEQDGTTTITYNGERYEYAIGRCPETLEATESAAPEE